MLLMLVIAWESGTGAHVGTGAVAGKYVSGLLSAERRGIPPQAATVADFDYMTEGAMSLSPTASAISNGSDNGQPNKRRRQNGSDANMAAHLMGGPAPPQGIPQQQLSPSQPNQSHIPKRGARACTACRKGKNRCEGEASKIPLSLPPPRSPGRRPTAGALQTLSAQRHPLRVREARKETEPVKWSQRRVRPPLIAPLTMLTRPQTSCSPREPICGASPAIHLYCPANTDPGYAKSDDRPADLPRSHPARRPRWPSASPRPRRARQHGPARSALSRSRPAAPRWPVPAIPSSPQRLRQRPP